MGDVVLGVALERIVYINGRGENSRLREQDEQNQCQESIRDAEG